MKLPLNCFSKAILKGWLALPRNMWKDFETAKEIVQECISLVCGKRERVSTCRNPLNQYLTTIIYNKSLNYLRDNKKFNRDILTFENLYPLADHDRGDKLVAAEIEKKIKASIEELPEKCREIFVLSRFQNLKYQQIADKLQVSIKR